MESLRQPGTTVIDLCSQLLAHNLTDLQENDILKIKTSAQTFIQRLADLKISDDYINKLRNEQRFDEIGHISHEIRAPLNVMIGYSEMMLEVADSLTDSQQGQVTRIVKLSGELETIIYELFDKDRHR